MSRLEELWDRLARWLLPDCSLRLAANGWTTYTADRFYGIPNVHVHHIDGHRLVLIDLGADKMCYDCGKRLRNIRWSPQHLAGRSLGAV